MTPAPAFTQGQQRFLGRLDRAVRIAVAVAFLLFPVAVAVYAVRP